MVIGKIKPTATIVAQFAAGVEIDAIQHEGKMYLPVVGMGEFATKDTDSTRTTEPSAPAPKGGSEKKKPSKEETAETKQYTEDELMEMETKELLKLCKSMGIDPDDTEGKNTNKKLRKLVLAAQEEADTDDDEEEEEDNEEDDELTSQVADILEDFDGGKKNKKKTISSLCGLVDDADKDAVTELVEKFEDDADADIDAMASKIAAILNGEEPEEDDEEEEEEEEKPAKKGKKSAKKDDEDEDEKPAKKGKGKKSKKDEDLVAVEDLEVGDRVSVWWDDDNQDWFDGEVKSISKKGKVVIAYDDDTEDAIDPEIHTKIKRIED